MGKRIEDGFWQSGGEKPESSDKSFNVDRTTLPEQKRLRYKQDTKWRRNFSVWVMVVVPVWLLAVIVLVYVSILGNYDVSSSVLNTLLATTTVNVLGLAYIILQGIFPKGQK